MSADDIATIKTLVFESLAVFLLELSHIITRRGQTLGDAWRAPTEEEKKIKQKETCNKQVSSRAERRTQV